ncbi:hypothetical protein LTR56_027915 [Elasticomyces elasticus]|nr:hypothetical protein LTR56_027915 [Elasticomyces elasticus]KAK3620539.1 hypothetical protein LTR22_025556 [Elasticomyces elasticus]KAK4907078.1 hypothetical protein LTR49_023871 [Elasticomyces elasticus]KAK5741125.1 hypothetical protein LTS12_024706 [Elasticomyces elasticus]
MYAHEEPKFMTVVPPEKGERGACLQTLEGHGGGIKWVAFSHDSTQLVSASEDGTVKIWDAGSGACLQTLRDHGSTVTSVHGSTITSVAFSHDSTELASASWDHTVKIWDARSSACPQTLERRSAGVTSQIFQQVQSIVNQSIGMSIDGAWITQNTDNPRKVEIFKVYGFDYQWIICTCGPSEENFGLTGMLGLSSNIIVSPEYMLVSLNFLI